MAAGEVAGEVGDGDSVEKRLPVVSEAGRPDVAPARCGAVECSEGGRRREQQGGNRGEALAPLEPAAVSDALVPLSLVA